MILSACFFICMSCKANLPCSLSWMRVLCSMLCIVFVKIMMSVDFSDLFECARSSTVAM